MSLRRHAKFLPGLAGALTAVRAEHGLFACDVEALPLHVSISGASERRTLRVSVGGVAPWPRQRVTWADRDRMDTGGANRGRGDCSGARPDDLPLYALHVERVE